MKHNSFEKIVRWYFGKKSLPYWCILLLDCLALGMSGIFVYFLSYTNHQPLMGIGGLVRLLLIAMVVSIVCFRVFSTYSGIIRYSSFADLRRLGMANVLAMTICVLLHYSFTDYSPFVFLSPRHIVAFYVVATLLMWCMRVVVRTLYDVVTIDRHAMCVLIYGATTDGVGLAEDIRNQRPMRFILRGFISHDSKLRHSLLLGEKVYGFDDDLARVIGREGIEGVIVSPNCMADFRANRDLQDVLLGLGIRIYIVPDMEEWGGKDAPENLRVREVSVEDLLPREEIKVDMEAVRHGLCGRCVLITGAAGSIGSELVRQVATCRPTSIILVDQAETPGHDLRLMMVREFPDIMVKMVVASICHQSRMEVIFKRFRPEYVFHAAAYKHVPVMEDNPSEAVINNVYGTKVIADLSDKYGVEKFVMVSTDKAVNPTNVMGCSKRICEIYVQSLDKCSKTQYVTTRFGNVLGSNGSVIPLFKEQIRRGGPVTVTHPDIVRFFMLIPEACRLVLEAGVKGGGGEIFAFDMGEPVRIAELAKRMIKLSGAKGIEIKYTGLREGEKLYEEVLSEQEGMKPSFHKKIYIAKVREYDYAQANKEIDGLIAISEKYDDMETVKKMKEIVPEYRSNNSKYERLDS